MQPAPPPLQPLPPAPPPPRRLALRIVALLAAALAAPLAGLGLLWATLPDPGELATRNPRTTALIEQRRAEAARARRAFRPQQVWVPLDRISRRLVEAVVASEDAKFFGHAGFDWAALQDAARHDLQRGRFARGASTITQQLAKNLYLGTEKSLVRKAKEALLAAKLERSLEKRRILALYLNVAEWGDGTFGVEAGARRHLGVSSASLDPAQAVLLASMLPAPRRVDLSRPSAWLRARATGLLDRLHAEHQLGDEEHRSASAALARLLAGPAPADDQEEPPEDEPAFPAAATAAEPPPAADAEAPGAAPVEPRTGEPAAEPPAPGSQAQPSDPGAAPAGPAPPAEPAGDQGSGGATGGQDSTPPSRQGTAPPQE